MIVPINENKAEITLATGRPNTSNAYLKRLEIPCLFVCLFALS